MTVAIAALDQLIVAALIVMPQSYLLWLHSREFEAPLWSRVWVYAIPGVLVAVRWLLAPRRARLPTDPVVVGLFIAVTAIGLLNALVRTAFPVNVLSTYVQQFYWMALAVGFLIAIADRPSAYLLTLIRRFYLFAAAVGLVYVDCLLVLGTSLPHTDVLLPGGHLVAENYYVSLSYPELGLLQLPAARYTFLFREPKILALHFLVGLILQTAYLWREWNGPERAPALGGLIVIAAGFFLANSIFAYIILLLLFCFLAAMPVLRRRAWRGFRTLAVTVVAVGLPLFIVALLALGQDRGAVYELAAASGKHVNAVRGYVQTIPRALLAAWIFPAGTGSMNLDSPRYEAAYGIATSGGTTLIQWAAQNAGVLGLGLLGLMVWRLLGLAERTAARVDDRAIAGACLGIGCLAVTSMMISDMLLIGVEGTLLVGWLLSLSRTTRAAVKAGEAARAAPAAPLRVVRVIARLNIGGPARQVALLESQLPARGYASWLVHGAPPAGEGELPIASGPGHEVLRVDALSRAVRFGGDLAAFWRIWVLLRRVEPDIVHTHTAKAGALGRIAAALYNLAHDGPRRVVVVHTFHGHVFRGYFGSGGTALVVGIERILARLTDRIVAISARQRADLVDVFRIAPADRVVVVPLGLDLEGLAAIPLPEPWAGSAGSRPVTVTFVGRLTPIKNVDLLLRAAARAFAGDARGRLVIAGDGQSRAELEALASRLGLGDRARFVGWQTDLTALYAGADIVALSSINEGTPVAAIEAMAAGRAVVSTAVGGVPDVVDDGRTGRLVPPGDEVALAEALAELMADDGLRARLGAAARAEATTRFGYARLVNDVDRLYRDVLASARGAAEA